MDLGCTVESIKLKQVSQPFLNAAHTPAKIQRTWGNEHTGQEQGQEEKPDFIFSTI